MAAPEPWLGQYANETYLRSLAASAGDIDRNVQNAYNEVGRQSYSAQVASGKVGTTNAHMLDDVHGGLAADLRSIGQQESAGLRSVYEGDVQNWQDVGGLLASGFRERATRQNGGIANIRTDLLGDLRQKGMEYVSRREQETRAQQFQAQQAERQRQLQEQLVAQQIAAQQRIQQMQLDEAQRQRSEELWIAVSRGLVPAGTTELTPAEAAKARYLAMKDKQNLRMDAR